MYININGDNKKMIFTNMMLNTKINNFDDNFESGQSDSFNVPEIYYNYFKWIRF